MNTANSSFKIIEVYVNHRIYSTWISLTCMVDYKNKRYLSIHPFNLEDFNINWFNINWIKSLFKKDSNTAPILEIKDNKRFYDIIRNPTLQEMNIIQKIFKQNNCIYNRKTNQLIIK